MTRKLVIVMTYFNRQPQLDRTLKSIAKSKHDNVEIVIVDDASPVPVKVPSPFKYPVHVITVTAKEKGDSLCPVVPYNRGIQKAFDLGAEVVVIQNAENFHVMDCLEFVERLLFDDNYLVFSCFSIDADLTAMTDIESRFPGLESTYGYAAPVGGANGWYNHPDVRPCFLHFFSAMTRKNMLRLNGFDERFAAGVAYDDDDLVRRVRNLGLVCQIPVGAFVVHQWHYSGPSPYDHTDRLHANYALIESLRPDVNQYRAVHLHTPDFSNE